MNRFDKRALLNQLIQGQKSGLLALKKEQHQINGIVIVDRMPNELSDEPVLASYTLKDGTKHIEQLSYSEVRAKAGNILIILPDKKCVVTSGY